MRTTFKIAGIGIGLLSSASLLAQETAPAMPNFGIQYRYEVGFDDDGLNKDAKADVPHMTQGLKAFRLLGEGKAADRLTYAFRMGMEGGNLAFDYGWVRWALSDNHGVLFGKQKARVFGWEYRLSNPLTLFTSHGLATSPFSYENMVAFENKYDWGTITLQLTDDKKPDLPQKVRTAGITSGWETVRGGEVVAKQPAIIVEYMGSFGAIKPLLQFATYDSGHSNLFTGGLLFEATDFAADLDYTTHNIGAKGVKTGGTKNENLVSTSTTIALNMSYQMGAYMPFVHFSAFDMDEFTNAGQAKSSVNDTLGDFDDNGTRMGLGVEFRQFNDAFRPYTALMMDSGKFKATDGSDKNMTRTEVLAGVRGQF